MSRQCNGYRRTGGAFTLGMPEWEQCTEEGIVVLVIDGKDMPSCRKCWEECLDNNVPIDSIKPMPREDLKL